MKDVIFFTVADENNLNYAQGVRNSFKRFHPDIEFKIYGPEFLNKINDPQKFYKMTPLIARQLIDDYRLVVKVDADSVICGELNHVLNDTSYELGCVRNFNQTDFKSFGKVSVWDIPAEAYMNCGFVAMSSKKMIDHWWTLCNSSFFNSYRYREQDLMNILYYYGVYRGTCFDNNDFSYGLSNKDHWLEFEEKDGLITYKQGDKDVAVKVIHIAEGNSNKNKFNFEKRFKPNVVKKLHELIS